MPWRWRLAHPAPPVALPSLHPLRRGSVPELRPGWPCSAGPTPLHSASPNNTLSPRTHGCPPPLPCSAREGCCLCAAPGLIAWPPARPAHKLQVVDMDTDPALKARLDLECRYWALGRSSGLKIELPRFLPAAGDGLGALAWATALCCPFPPTSLILLSKLASSGFGARPRRGSNHHNRRPRFQPAMPPTAPTPCFASGRSWPNSHCLARTGR